MHGESPIKRRESRKIWVGNVPVGGDAPIAVQSMTNSDTNDVAATVAQINRLEAAGVDIVRVSVPDMDAAEAFGRIKQLVKVPLVADIHFDYRIALRVAELGVDCLRINPGNIGREDRVRAVVDAARDRGIPIRIGVNAGSLEKDLQKKYGEPTPAALVESALRHVEHLERLNFKDFKVSVKASDVFMAVEAYRLLAKEIVQPLHLGITEAGGLRSGTVKSAVGLGMLLAEGIGDTIRISLAADPVEEVKVGYDILKSLHLRSRGINFIACPSCSRQNFDVVKTMNELEVRLEDLLVPLVADIHFDYKIALRVAELGVDCLRINPGNIGREDRVRAVVDAARDRGIPIRIGVNAGSLEKDLQKKYGEPTPAALVESALRHVEHLERLNFQDFKVSVKASDVFMAVEAYRLLAKEIVQPLHLGITEAGGLRSGTVKSAVGLGMLLAEGIGDTIRISLAADPVEEVKVGYDILKSLRLRSRGINFIACPSCSRQNFDVVKTMNDLELRLEDLLVPLDVAVIGCVVNGPGEAKEAHVGLTGGTPNLIYIDGKPSQKLTNDNLVDELEKLIREKAAEKVAADAALIARG